MKDKNRRAMFAKKSLSTHKVVCRNCKGWGNYVTKITKVDGKWYETDKTSKVGKPHNIDCQDCNGTGYINSN